MRGGEHGGVWSAVESEGVCLVVVGGVPAAASARAAGRRIRAAQRRGCDVLVDVSPLTACPVAVLDGLVRARRRAERRGLGFAVVAAPRTSSSDVRRVLALVGLVPPERPV